MIANSHSACFSGLWGSLGSGHRHCVVHVLCWSGRSWHAVEWPLKVAIIGGLVRAHRAAFPVSCGRHQTADFQPSFSPIILNGAVCQDFFSHPLLLRTLDNNPEIRQPNNPAKSCRLPLFARSSRGVSNDPMPWLTIRSLGIHLRRTHIRVQNVG